MAKSKHIISKAKAEKLIKQFAERKNAKRSPLKVLPQGFMMPADEVRRMLEHPNAAHLVIQFGLKISTKGEKTTETIAPVLCAAQADYTIIERRSNLKSNKPESMMALSEASLATEDLSEAGDYLDEGQGWPPPPPSN